MNRLTLLALSLVLTASFADLILYEAGEEPMSLGPIDGQVVCPSDYLGGINIQCTDLPGATFAKFFVDGEQVRMENTRPYYLAGDNVTTGEVKMWQDYPEGDATISCEGSNGLTQTASVTFACDTTPSDEPVMEPSPTDDALAPGTLIWVAAGRSGKLGPVVMDGMTFCPADYGLRRFTVQCIGDEDTVKAKFFIDGTRVKTDPDEPYYINGDRNGRVRPWVAPTGFFDIECRVGRGMMSVARVRVACPEGATPEPEPMPMETPEPQTMPMETPEPQTMPMETPEPQTMPMDTPEPQPMAGNVPGVMTKPDGCVVIDARGSSLSDGWEETDEGLIYKKGDTDTGIDGKGEFPLSYKFTPTVTSNYAVVVDMTTQDGTDYNDIWLRIAGNFNLIQEGEIASGKGNGWIKGYHNANGRASLISSIDFDPHSISTRMTLEEGVEYTFEISGRSTQVEVHRIVLFPCGEGDSVCQRSDSMWKAFMRTCANM